MILLPKKLYWFISDDHQHWLINSEDLLQGIHNATSIHQELPQLQQPQEH